MQNKQSAVIVYKYKYLICIVLVCVQIQIRFLTENGTQQRLDRCHTKIKTSPFGTVERLSRIHQRMKMMQYFCNI